MFLFYRQLYAPVNSRYTYKIMSKKAKKQKKVPSIQNRRAHFDYELGDEIIAGIVLTGPETRAARDGHIQLKGSFVTIKNDELWLNNASFSLKIAQRGLASQHTVDTSPRKLLASRKQITTLAEQKKNGLTIVPTKLLTAGRFIKVVIALGKGKKRYDKRETLKRRDQERDANRAMKHA